MSFPTPKSVRPLSVSGSNLVSHMGMGSLKKGSKQSMSLPSTAYNTLPSHHHLKTSSSSPRVANAASASSHKRSPSSDSGHGTLHNPLASAHHPHLQQHQSSSRSTTPVSYHGGKVHHTVYLHGKDQLYKSLTSGIKPCI